MVACTYNCFMNVINIGNSIIGVSILAMPYCFSKCGILLSTVLIIISGLLTKLACYLLLKSAVMARRRSFEFLAFHTFGPYGKLVVEMSVIGFLIGVCIAFFVVIGDLGPPLAAEFLNIEKATNLRTNVLILVGFCVALPLGLLRKIDSLTSLSALSIAFYVCLILKIFAEAVPNLTENEWWYAVNWWKSDGILPCLPIFSMALSCQTQLFEFFDTTNDPSIKRMLSVVDGAVYLCSLVYLLVGAFGYIAFHDKNITGNILLLLTPSVISEFIKLGFIITVAVSFPLCLFPCRSSLHSLLFKQGFVHHDINVNTIPDHRFRILTVSLVIVTIGIAIMLPNIEFVLGIIGSTIGTLICLILPAIIFINDSNKMSSEKRKAQILFGIGTFILVACTFSTLQENKSQPESLHNFPNIKKITSAPFAAISSMPPNVIQSPKIALVTPVIKLLDPKIEISDTKILDDQKRLEPPIPQEPDVKIEPIGDLDPQALQKEDKELQKDVSHLSANSPGFKNDDGLEKQEKLLEKLEEHQKRQKQILEEQRKVLEELKQHKESHEKMEKQETEQRKKVVQSSEKPSLKMKSVLNNKINSNLNKEKIPVDNIDDQFKLFENKKYSISPVPRNNLSLNHISLQEPTKKPEEIYQKNLVQNMQINENTNFEKKPSEKKMYNDTFVNLKPELLIKNQNVSVPNQDSNILNNPTLIKKDVIKPKIQKTKDTEMHVKHRETLAKKAEFEVTVLTNQDVNTNIVLPHNEKKT